MIKDVAERVERVSPNIVTEQIEELKSIFPEAFTEGKIDFDQLKAALGDIVDTQPEKYSFTWAGKRNAIQLLQTPSSATLVPDEDESIDFDTTQNLFLEGDNLEVLKLLYKSYAGRVKMIYIDPPYNTGNDFVYPDDFVDPLDTYLKITGQKDANGNLLTSNPETNGRYHSTWLSMMYPRLYLARQLLREDGVIFVSIDDHEVYNLRMLMNEIFGEENFAAQIVWQKKYAASNDAKGIPPMHDYIMVYQKSDTFERKLLPRTDKQDSMYKYDDNDGRGAYRTDNLLVRTYSANAVFPIKNPNTGKEFLPKGGNSWRASKETITRWLAENRIFFGKDGKGAPQLKRYLSEVQQGLVPVAWWTFTDAGHNDEANKELQELFGESRIPFDTPKPTKLIKRILQISTDKNDLILDFFAGSGTTAHAVMQLNAEDGGNRKWIMVQLPEETDDNSEARKAGYSTIADIAKERIRRVIAKMKHADQSKLDLSNREEPEDLGFRVFKLAPSNYKQWHGVERNDAEAYTKQLALFTDPLVENWTPENVLWEVAIKEGYGLNARIEKLEELQDNTVWKMADPDKDQSLLLCLDDELKPATLSALPLTREHIFVCRNKALDDTKAANLALQCRLKKI